MPADISVIVVNYNGRRHLERCLSAVLRQDRPCEVVVVDNGSTDGSASFVRDRFPAVRLIALDRNMGFAGGNNAGTRAATGRYLAFLNNDTEPALDWVSALVRALERSPETGFVTSRIVFMHDRTIVDSAGDCVTRSGGAYKRGHGTSVGDVLASREVFGACGAACLFRREVFEDVGGFDEDFFMSHEDVDLSYRAQLRGYRCLYVADAVVAHVGSATLGRVSSVAVYYGQRNLEWVYFKNTPWPLLLRTLPGHLVYVAAAGIYFTAIGRIGQFVAGKWGAIRGARRLWQKRRATQRSRRVSSSEIWNLLEPRWLATKVREERFDLGMAKSS